MGKYLRTKELIGMKDESAVNLGCKDMFESWHEHLLAVDQQVSEYLSFLTYRIVLKVKWDDLYEYCVNPNVIYSKSLSQDGC